MSAQATSLLELLQQVPKDAHMMYDHGDGNHQEIQVGMLCSAAAQNITQLKEYIVKINAVRDEENTAWANKIEQLEHELRIEQGAERL